MVCQPVNLEERGMTGNSYHCLTVKGVRWVDEVDGGSDGQMLLMAESGRVEGSIRKTTSGSKPKEKKDPIRTIVCKEENHYYLLQYHYYRSLDRKSWKFLLLPAHQHWLLANLTSLSDTLNTGIWARLWVVFVILVFNSFFSFRPICPFSRSIIQKLKKKVLSVVFSHSRGYLHNLNATWFVKRNTSF